MKMKIFKKLLVVGVTGLLSVAGVLPMSAQAASTCDAAASIPSNNGVTVLCSKKTRFAGFVEPVQGVSGKWVFLGSPASTASGSASVYVSELTAETTMPLPLSLPANTSVELAIDANDVVYVMPRLDDVVYRFDGTTGARLSDFSLGGTNFLHIHQNRLGEVLFTTRDLSASNPSYIIYDVGGQIRYEVDRGVQPDGDSMVSRLRLSGFQLVNETFSIRSVGSSAALFFDGADGERRILDGLTSKPRKLFVDRFTGDVYLIAKDTVIARAFQVYLVNEDSVTLLFEPETTSGFGYATTASDGVLIQTPGPDFFVSKTGTVTEIDDEPAVTAGLGESVGTNHFFSRTSAGVIGQFAYLDEDGVYRFYMAKLNDTRDGYDIVSHGAIGNPGGYNFNTSFGSYDSGLIMMSQTRGIIKVPNSAIFEGSAVVSESSQLPNIASSKFKVGSTFTLRGENLGIVNSIAIGQAGGACSTTGTAGCVIQYDSQTNRDFLSMRLPLNPGDYAVVVTTNFGTTNLGNLSVVSVPIATTNQTEVTAGGLVQIQIDNPELIDAVRIQREGRALIRTIANFNTSPSGISFELPSGLDTADYTIYLRSDIYDDGVRIADQTFSISVSGITTTVSGFVPNQGVAPGETVTISGAGLEGAKAVLIQDGDFSERVELDSVSNTEVTFTAPYLDGGPYKLILETTDGLIDLLSTTGKFFEYETAEFAVNSVEGNENVLPGDLVVMEGVEMGSVEKVLIDGESATITDQQDGKLEFSVPDVSRDQHIIFVQIGGELFSTQQIVTYQPRELNISEIAPNIEVQAGDTVRITGSDLDSIDKVMVGEVEATISSKLATSVVFSVPQQPRSTYPITVVIGADKLSTGYELTYKPISVGDTAVQAPEEPRAGDSVTITGEGLDQVEEVLIGGLPAQVVSQDDGSVTVILPEGEDGSQDVVFIIDGEEVPTGAAVNYGGFVPDTEFKVWTTRLNDTQAKIYAKNPIGMGKIQFVVDGEEIAWIRAEDITDSKLRVITEGPMRGASYLVRTVDLKPGKNALEVYQGDERIRRTAYSR